MWILIRAILYVALIVSLEAKKKPAPPPTLSERYAKLSCAVVQIAHPGGMGTGFFINASGDVVTAAHVALNRAFSEPSPGEVRVDIDYKPQLHLAQTGHPPIRLQLPKLETVDVNRAMNDLVILRTGIKSPCHLMISVRASEKVGDHMIAIGYPISAPTGALYEGFVSAKYRHLPIPMAIVNNKPIYPMYDVIRVQMPITPGASGGPVIADGDMVIGVVTENPTVWFNDLNALIHHGQSTAGGFSAPESDLPKMLAMLAWVVQEFVTSGAGLAVPVSYLALPAQMVPKPAQQKATIPEPLRRHGWFRSLIDRQN